MVGASSPPRNQCQAWIGLVYNRAELGEQIKKKKKTHMEGQREAQATLDYPRLRLCMSILTSLSLLFHLPNLPHLPL